MLAHVARRNMTGIDRGISGSEQREEGRLRPINAMEAFKNDFRCITMDQRNANGGESTGPVQVDSPGMRSPTTSLG
jgi:hypothetical protein